MSHHEEVKEAITVQAPQGELPAAERQLRRQARPHNRHPQGSAGH